MDVSSSKITAETSALDEVFLCKSSEFVTRDEIASLPLDKILCVTDDIV